MLAVTVIAVGVQAVIYQRTGFTRILGTAHALWIPIKAELAQYLLERSWRETLAGDTDARPWPWADTRAIGVLEVPRLGLREIVLEGSSGRNLAFGPALVNTTRLNDTADRILRRKLFFRKDDYFFEC